jgi:hypothetical protein
MPQPQDIPRLGALTLDAIREATDRYLEDGNAARWEKAISQIVTRGHMAGYLLGASERLGVSLDSGLITARNLSRAERDDLKALISDQLDYLKRFIDIAGDLSEAQIRNRADQYALATKQSYWQGWAGDAELDCIPGSCPECYANCRCSLRHEADGIYWDCADDAHSCEACSQRGAMQPYAAHGGSNGGVQIEEQTAWENTDDATLRSAGLVTDKKLKPAQATSLQWYQGVGHDRINAELRGSERIRDQYTLDNTTRILDSIMQRSRLQQPVTVQRGMLLETSEAQAQIARWQPGTTFRDPGYVSTTVSPDVARRFGAGVTPGDDSVQTVDVRIRVPAGTPAIYMPTAQPLRAVAEQELLLGRNLTYRVVERTEQDGKITVVLEVVP